MEFTTYGKLEEWCDFLKNNKTAFTEFTFVIRMPQELFNAVYEQEILKNYILNGAFVLIFQILKT